MVGRINRVLLRFRLDLGTRLSFMDIRRFVAFAAVDVFAFRTSNNGAVARKHTDEVAAGIGALAVKERTDRFKKRDSFWLVKMQMHRHKKKKK